MTDRADAVRLESKVYKAQEATRVPFRANLASNHNPGMKAKNPGPYFACGSNGAASSERHPFVGGQDAPSAGREKLRNGSSARGVFTQEIRRRKETVTSGAPAHPAAFPVRTSEVAGRQITRARRDERQQDVLDWGALSILRLPKRLLGRRPKHSGER